MGSRRPGRRTALALGVLLVSVVLFGVARWEDIVVAYHVRRLRTSPEHFTETLRDAGRTSLRWRAARAYVGTEEGTRELITRIFDELEQERRKRLPDAGDLRLELSNEAVPAVFLPEAAGVLEVNVTFKSPVRSVYLAGVDDLMSELMELLADGVCQEVCLPDHPDLTFTISPVTELPSVYSEHPDDLARLLRRVKNPYDHCILVRRPASGLRPGRCFGSRLRGGDRGGGGSRDSGSEPWPRP